MTAIVKTLLVGDKHKALREEISQYINISSSTQFLILLDPMYEFHGLF